MLLLGLDTSTAVGVALTDGTRVLARRSVLDQRRHAELLAPAVRDVLAEAGADRRDLEAIAVGVGPAPFTGLRVGVVTALTLGEVLGIGVHGVCSLDAHAATALAQPGLGADLVAAGGFLVAADARRREVHWARYATTGTPGTGTGAADPLRGWVRVTGPDVGPADRVDTAGLPSVGGGAQLYAAALPGPDGPVVLDPGWLALLAADRLSRGEALLPPVPLYLRRPDATEPTAPKRVTA